MPAHALQRRFAGFAQTKQVAPVIVYRQGQSSISGVRWLLLVVLWLTSWRTLDRRLWSQQGDENSFWKRASSEADLRASVLRTPARASTFDLAVYAPDRTLGLCVMGRGRSSTTAALSPTTHSLLPCFRIAQCAAATPSTELLDSSSARLNLDRAAQRLCSVVPLIARPSVLPVNVRTRSASLLAWTQARR